MSKKNSVSKTENTNSTSNVVPLHGTGRVPGPNPYSIFVGHREILQSCIDATAS